MAQTNQPDAFSRLLIQRLINLGQPVTAHSQDLKSAGICYCHDWNGVGSGVMASLTQNPPRMDLILAGQTEPWPRIGGVVQTVKLNPFPVLTPGSQVFSASNLYATLSFLHAIRIAQKEGLDWFFLIEPDCRFAGHGWLRALWQEFLMVKTRSTLVAGTPVAWSGTEPTGMLLPDVLKLPERCMVETGIKMQVLPSSGQVAVGINGALGWYRTDVIASIFNEGMNLIIKPRCGSTDLDINAYCNRIGAWDYHLASLLYSTGSVSQIAILSGSYSACGDSQMDEQARLKLLADGKKLAVHQVKG